MGGEVPADRAANGNCRSRCAEYLVFPGTISPVSLRSQAGNVVDFRSKGEAMRRRHLLLIAVAMLAGGVVGVAAAQGQADKT